MNNYEQTVISQYGNSDAILALIGSFNDAVDPSSDIDNFYVHIWDVATATGFGLDIWGRIVGVSRTIPTTPATVLTDGQFLELILLKALANISRATSYSINTLLTDWAGTRGRAYVNDLGNMQIRYMFEFALEPYEITILTKSGILLRPAGVGGSIINTVFPVFGFQGMTEAAPFNQAPFVSGIYPVS